VSPDRLRTLTAHAAAVLTAARDGRTGAHLVSAVGTLEMLSLYFGYRLVVSVSAAGGSSLHVTDPTGNEFSERGSSLIDCFHKAARGPLGAHLERHTAAAVAEARARIQSQDRDEGNTHE